jgi:hypothetical protein
MPEKHVALTSFGHRKHLILRWGDEPVSTLPLVFRMAVGQVGIVSFDAERLNNQNILQSVFALPRGCVEIVDLLDRKT